MNVEFFDYFSERAWHATIGASEENRRELHRFIDTMIDGGWSDHSPVPITREPARPNYPDMYSFEGRRRTRIRISCCANDVVVLNGEPIAQEFNWQIQSQPVNKYGYADDDKWQVRVVGGFINHARFLQWVSPRTGKVTKEGDTLWPVFFKIGEQAQKDSWRYKSYQPSLQPDWERRNHEPRWSVHT